MRNVFMTAIVIALCLTIVKSGSAAPNGGKDQAQIKRGDDAECPLGADEQ